MKGYALRLVLNGKARRESSTVMAGYLPNGRRSSSGIREVSQVDDIFETHVEVGEGTQHLC